MSFDPNYNEKPDKRPAYCTDYKNYSKWMQYGFSSSFQWTEKCQICGRILKVSDHPDVNESARNVIVESQKRVRCSTCASWTKKGYMGRIRAGWEEYLAQTR